MKKVLLLICICFFIQNMVLAKTDLKAPEHMTKKEITVLTEGQSFNYPLKEGDIIECYAKRIDGSIDDFKEYNDYFVVRNGHLYSNTMHKIYKPDKANILKKVDKVRLIHDKEVLNLYDPLWEPSFRCHQNRIKINLKTGKYYMKGTKDNWMWYQNIVSDGYCRVIHNEK